MIIDPKSMFASTLNFSSIILMAHPVFGREIWAAILDLLSVEPSRWPGKGTEGPGDLDVDLFLDLRQYWEDGKP